MTETTEATAELRKVAARMRKRDAAQKEDLQKRDELIVAARAEGTSPAVIAATAEVTRGRVQQVLRDAKNRAA